MEPRIEILSETILIGKKTNMSFAANKTIELWQNFMQKQKEIKNPAGTDFYSIEIYNNTAFFKNFNPTNEFEKWAAIRVNNFDNVPDGLSTLVIPKGQYAVFNYKGKASEIFATYQFIYNNWLPDCDYELDDRPHFTLMGEKYKGENPGSEEEIWIPIRRK